MANSTPFEPDDLLRDAASIRRLSRALIKDRTLADDVAQEAFLSVARAQSGRTSSTPIESRSAWLRTIVLNVARSMGRSKVRRAHRESAVARPEVIPSTASILEREEARRTLVEGVLALEEPYRSTLILRYLEELSLGEVAQRLGVSKETVRTRSRRGLEQLRVSLDGAFGGPDGTGRALALLAIPGALLPPLTPVLPAGDLPCPKGAASGTLPSSAPVAGLIGSLTMKTKITILATLAGLFLVALPHLSDGLNASPLGETLSTDPGLATELASVPDAEVTSVEGLPSAARSSVAPAPPLNGPADGPASETGSLRIAAKWSDGSPATGVGILFTRRPLPHAERHPMSPVVEEEWIVTDTAGHAQLADRWPGKFTVEADRGNRLTAEVEADQEATVDFVLEGGTDVTGTVVDPLGQPVVDAEVSVVNWHLDWRSSRPVTRTGPGGHFTVRTVGQKRSLAASADGYGPSALFALSSVTDPGQPAAPSAHVVLTLTADGATARGVVLDPSGAPVSGAVVTAVTETMAGLHSSGFGSPSRWLTRSDRTGNDGRFELAGLPVGEYPIAVSHPLWPLWHGQIALAAGQDKQLEVRFSEPAWVFGVVRLPDGTPARTGDVVVLADATPNDFPLMGPWDQAAPFRRPRVVCQADGSFEIGPLTPGEVHLHASQGTTAMTRDDESSTDYQGTLQASLQVAPGERLEWNPQLSLGASLRGRVVFSDGTPIEDAFVTAFRSDDDQFSASTDEHGAFLIPGLAAVPYTLSFEPSGDAPVNTGVAVLYGVMPSGDEHVLTADYVPAAPVAPCLVKVRVLDTRDEATHAGSAAPEPRLYNADMGSLHSMHADEHGIYEGIVSPGHYRLVLVKENRTLQVSVELEALTGEELDLGTIHAQDLGTVALTIQRPAGCDGEVRVQIKGDGFYWPEAVTLDAGRTEVSLQDVVTGPVRLEVSGAGFASEHLEIDVLSGEVTAIDVTLRQGALVPLEIGLERTQGYRRVEYSVTSPTGQLLKSGQIAEFYQREWPIKHDLTLAPGSYQVEIETSDGQTFSGAIVVDSMDAQDPFEATAR